MDNKFLRSFVYYALAVILLAITFAAKSQSGGLQFSKPTLVSGTSGEIGATYKFPNVTTGIDAYIKIENIVGGAVLKNIDDTTVGYYKAWQPTVSGPGTYGSSYIKWDIRFTSKAGVQATIPEVDATGIDIDGDGVKIREFTMVNGQSSYTVPTQVPTALTITTEADTDNVAGTDASTTNLKALGPVTTRADIDTLSQDVRIDYILLNVSEFKFYTGSEVDNNGNHGAISPDRYHSIYFDKISGTFSILKVQYQNFNAYTDQNNIDISWQSDADSKNAHFEIEKSFTPDAFNTLAVILGPESESSSMGNYSFKDNSSDNASHNIIYYRLKIVDANENINYSSVIAVRKNVTTDNNTVVKVFPNPFVEKVMIDFNSKETGTAQFSLCNSSGNVVKKLQQPVTIGSNTIVVNDLSQQSAGIYFINVSVNGKIIESHKLMKM